MATRAPIVRSLTWFGLIGGAILALASVVVLHGAALIAVVIAGALGAAVAAAVVHSAERGRAAAVAAAWMTAAWTISTIMLVAGAGVVAGGVVAAWVGVLAAAVPGVRWLVRARQARKRRRGAPAPSSARGGSQPTRLLPAAWPGRPPLPVSLLSTSVLGSEWLQTTATLTRPLDPAARREVVRRRQDILDELELRDPVGLARWMATGATPDNDPAQFVRRDPTAGTDAA